MSLTPDFTEVTSLVSNQLYQHLPRSSEDDYKTPGELAAALDPMTVQTPALTIIDTALVEVDKAIEAMLKRRRLNARYRAAGMSETEARDCAESEVPTSGLDRLLISLPPQEGKSERASHYGTLWFLRRHPDLRMAIVSYEERIAQRMSYLLRNDIETFDGSEGNVDVGLRLKKDNRSVGSWNLDGHRGSVYAIGIGGALTGRPVDLLVIDDPVKDYRAADSSLQSELAWQWWMSVARTRLAPGAPVIIILTRWHEADMAGRLLSKQREDEKSEMRHFDRWHVINIPAQADHNPELGETDVLGREPGEYLPSARGRTQSQWEAIKNGITPRIWSALYQGKPSPDSGDVFHRGWWMRFSTPTWTEQPDGSFIVHEANEVIQSWDLAFKDKNSSDFVVGQVWARRGAYAYLLDQVRARLSFTDTLTAFRRLCQRWPQAVVKLVEDKANGPAVINSLRQDVGGIIPVQVKDSKAARASAVSPFVESNNVFLPTADIAVPGFEVELFIEECTQFPNAAHDDQVDAMTQALHRFFLKGSGAKAWMESLSPPCPECGQPNPRGAQSCGRCSASLVDDEPDVADDPSTQDEPPKPSEPFSLSTWTAPPLPPNTQIAAVQEAIRQNTPQQPWYMRDLPQR